MKKRVDCPCPFAASQLKCVLPDGKSYVCISKPAIDGEFGSDSEVRDCEFVKKAWEGLI